MANEDERRLKDSQEKLEGPSKSNFSSSKSNFS